MIAGALLAVAAVQPIQPISVKAVAVPAVPTSPLPCPLDKPYDPQNPFARIIRGELPRSPIFEDDRVIVIVPLEWDNPGHALVIPKAPVRNLYDMSPEDMGHALAVARRVGTAQQRALGATGFTVTQNNARSQHVCHVHFHVIPNTPLAPQDPASPAELERMAALLRAAFPPD